MKAIFISDGRSEVVRQTAALLQKKGFRVIVNRCPAGSAPAGCEITDYPLTDHAALQAGLSQLGSDLFGVIHPAPPYLAADVETATQEQWDRAFQEGPLAALNVTQAAGAVLESLGGGRIIYYGDMHSDKPTGGGFLYSMAEGAMQMLCREASQDFAVHGVSCHFLKRGVSPEDLSRANSRSNVYSAPHLQIPTGKLIGPESYAGIIEFLLSDAGAALNGADLQADGGAVMFYGTQVDDEEIARRVADKASQPPVEVGAFVHGDPVPACHKGRVALITGGGKGVGAGIARVFCAAGMKVCINYNSSKELAEATLKEIQDNGGEAFLYHADVTDRAQLTAMVEETVRRYGGLDVLVNNAALQPNRYIRQYDNETFARLWTINIGGYWNALQVCLPYLRKSPAGRVVNVSSVHGKRPTIFDIGYAMTKGAIRMFTREAALELGPTGITVNYIGLGGCSIERKTGNFAFLSYWPPETRVNPGPLERKMCLPEDVGHLALYLAAPNTKQLTGAGVRLDSGMQLA